jgi:hypothetical protein
MAIGAALAFDNAAFWLVWALLTPALPAAYFADPDARVTRTEHGLQYRLTTDIDPMPILVERPLMYLMGREPRVVFAA